MGRRRAAIDISPTAVQRLADKVAIMEANHHRSSIECEHDSITCQEVEGLYTNMQLIHRGRSCLVYRAREVRSGQRVVLKAYDTSRLSPAKRATLDRHICTLRAAMTHVGPNGGVVALVRVVENPGCTYLVMQACNGGTLIEAIANGSGKLPERQVAIKVALPMLKTLSQLHQHGIVHRDIKPEHLMIHNGNLKLGDFASAACMYNINYCQPGSPMKRQSQCGTTKHSQQHYSQWQQQSSGDEGIFEPAVVTVAASSITSGLSDANAVSDASLVLSGPLRDPMNFRTGSIEYMAPEMLNKPTAAEVFHLVIAQGIDEDDLPSYTEKVDIWSLGVVLYEALSGIQPFLADSPADMAAVIASKLERNSSIVECNARHLQGQMSAACRKSLDRTACAARCTDSKLPAFIACLPCSEEGKEFVAACLTWNPAQRPSAAVLLQHPWMKAMQEQAATATAALCVSRRLSIASMTSSGSAVQAPALPGQPATGATAAMSVDLCCLGVLPPISRGSADWPCPIADKSVPIPAKNQAANRQAPAGSGDTGGQQANSSSTLLAGMVGSALRERDPRKSLGLEPSLYSRSQTSEHLEVRARSVLRSKSQRLEPKASVPHVHVA
eukprot:GHRR01007284.1.p1 GENE.GHRR01007284.1~~GHRR01007284.1.p1  ORF type:complete len:612 (+),score=201.29 GHRR01007284.1:621-2456(+)